MPTKTCSRKQYATLYKKELRILIRTHGYTSKRRVPKGYRPKLQYLAAAAAARACGYLNVPASGMRH